MNYIIAAVGLFTASLIIGGDNNDKRSKRKSFTGVKASVKTKVSVSATYQTFRHNESDVSYAHVQDELRDALHKRQSVIDPLDVTVSSQDNDHDGDTKNGAHFPVPFEDVDLSGDGAEISRANFATLFKRAQDENAIDDAITSFPALMQSIKQSPEKYAHMTQLNLSSQNISGAFKLHKLIAQLPNLEQLDLDDNNITHLSDKYFDKPHTKLIYFSIKNNKLEALNLTAFLENFPNIKELKVDQNKNITIYSQHIIDSTNCKLYCRECKFSEKELALLAYNAFFMPKSCGETWASIGCHIFNMVEPVGESFAGMRIVNYLLPDQTYAPLIALGGVYVIASLRNFLMTKGLMTLIFPPEKRTLRHHEAYQLVYNNSHSHNEYTDGEDISIV